MLTGLGETYICVAHHGPWGPMFGPVIGPGQAWAHHAHQPIGGAQVWAHNRPWASLGPSWPMGGPSLGPQWALGKLGPIMAQGGAQV